MCETASKAPENRERELQKVLTLGLLRAVRGDVDPFLGFAVVSLSLSLRKLSLCSLCAARMSPEPYHAQAG